MLKKVFFVALAATVIQTTVPKAHAIRHMRRSAATGAPTQCRKLIPLGNLIWKGCAGSGHLSGDPRGNGVALIAPLHTALQPQTCMPIYSSAGKQIAAMQLYHGNNGLSYDWRGYSNYGCGMGKTMTSIRNASRNQPIYIRVTRTQCIKINRSYSNINSSQRC